MMPITLRIGGCLLQLHGVSVEEIPENTRLFICDCTVEPEFTYTFHFVDQLPSPSSTWQTVYQRYNIHVWRQDELERRLLSVNSPADAYCVYEEKSNNGADIWFLSPLRGELTIDTMFISCLSLERRMTAHNAYILHCAYLNFQGKAILFSGPSGIGKSTHAELWTRHVEGCRVMNGDRCLIRREADGSYSANGWPVCGSSGICHDVSLPLSAIVFIEQTPENLIIPEGMMQLYRRLFAQFTINHWDTEATVAGMDWIQALMEKVKVYVYGCNMAPDAPMALKNVLSPSQA